MVCGISGERRDARVRILLEGGGLLCSKVNSQHSGSQEHKRMHQAATEVQRTVQEVAQGIADLLHIVGCYQV